MVGMLDNDSQDSRAGFLQAQQLLGDQLSVTGMLLTRDRAACGCRLGPFPWERRCPLLCPTRAQDPLSDPHSLRLTSPTLSPCV